MSDRSVNVPTLGESIMGAKIVKWHKKQGEAVQLDEIIVELETDKITLDVPSQYEGFVHQILRPEGENVQVGEALCIISEEKPAQSKPIEDPSVAQTKATVKTPQAKVDLRIAPSAKAIGQMHGLEPENIVSYSDIEKDALNRTIISGRDMQNAIDQIKPNEANEPDFSITKPQSQSIAIAAGADLAQNNRAKTHNDCDREEIVEMSGIRKTIARKLKLSQDECVSLTTFNEIDMTPLIEVRNALKEECYAIHGVKLGFMSFFIKAAAQSLKQFPIINASIFSENDKMYVLYKKYYDISVAVATDKGLIVPNIKNADRKTLVEIEKDIVQMKNKANAGSLTLEEIQGGTFTISNGGIYGSMMSTPVINYPQSAILGMHNIQQRPTVVNGEIKIRDMMFVALSYDHRIIDGKDAVSFLKHIKDAIENPTRFLLM